MIESLHIAGFKLFRDLTLPKLGRMNLFVGENNTGKSCLLEAIGLYAGRNPAGDILQAAALRSQQVPRPWEADGWNEQGTALRHPLFDMFHWAKAIGEPSIGSRILIEIDRDPNPMLMEVQARDAVINVQGEIRYVRITSEDEAVSSMEYVVAVHRGGKQVALVTRQTVPLYSHILDPIKLQNDDALVVAHLPAIGYSNEKAASLWDSLIQGPGQERVLNWLRLVDPRIEDLDYIAGQLRLDSRVALLKVEGKGRIPLSTMGDGMRRMLHIGLAMATSSKGILLIDEFENGLHWRVQQELWAALGKAAQEFDVQIFATTYSRDCIGGFVSASAELGIKDATLYRMEREGDEIYAVSLALINVEDALEVNGEVR